ncbi:hypothetical protein ACQZ5N_23955 [Agrobacterium sp. 22-221-1]|uniref:Uncharacterized protein n=1 Tax=Agrobacterium deltaense NCPPB 1641 TaxID=1183425 RepID=A0A1S7TVX6_9HYPH|nr:MULTISPECIES: hypothetical protein [Agrobacterium]WFS68263.1 hypothetical protein CFBP4996_19810 [Agrobacterium leguminum]CVI58745.1 conserved membrane hypothetical protein [Agrobacterium deltaense NCPPB 1641]
MHLTDLLDAIGIKLGVLIAGLAGGLLRALSRQKYTWREMLASPVCGALAAAYLTTPLLHYLYSINWPLPEDPIATMNAAAFLTGASAMWISDLIIEAMQRWVRGGKSA